MGEKFRPIAIILVICAALVASPFPAMAEDEAVDEAPRKGEQPKRLERPTGLKPYFLSRPPERLSPGD